jgi:hypothetical protein
MSIGVSMLAISGTKPVLPVPPAARKIQTTKASG